MVNRGNESSFELYATPSETTSSSDLIAALKEELNKIKRDGVTKEELKRVKTIVIADDVYIKKIQCSMQQCRLVNLKRKVIRMRF